METLLVQGFAMYVIYFVLLVLALAGFGGLFLLIGHILEIRDKRKGR